MEKTIDVPQAMLEQISRYSTVHELEQYQNQIMQYLISSASSIAVLIEEQSNQMNAFVKVIKDEPSSTTAILKTNQYQHTVSRFFEAVVMKQKLSLRSAEIGGQLIQRFNSETE